MPTTYNLAPSPVWQFTDFAAKYLKNGKMYTYRNTARTELKPVYTDPEGTTPWENPLIFSDPDGSAYPIYWASDEDYYVELYDENDNLKYVFTDFNSPGFGANPSPDAPPINKNFVLDGQFRFPVALSQSLTIGNFLSAQCFYNSNGGPQVNDFVFNRFAPGQTQVPSNPVHYLSAGCNAPVAGSFPRIEFYFGDSNTFETYRIAFGFWAKSALGSAISVNAIQYFGSGGSPSEGTSTPIFSATLTPEWTFYQGTCLVPSTSGKTLGTNNDDTLSIWVSYPAGAIFQVDQTNFQCQLGALLTNYDYNDYNQVRAEVYGQKLPVPAFGNPSPDNGKYVTLGAETSGAGAGFNQPAFVLTSLALYYGVSAGTNTYTSTLVSPSISSYETGRIYNIAIGSTNTGASTININGVGIASITLFGGIPLSFGNLAAGMIAQILFDGTKFLLLNPSKASFYLQAVVNANQLVNNGATADVLFDLTVEDTSGFYNNLTGRFTPTFPCRVFAKSNVNFNVPLGVTGDGIQVQVSKNGIGVWYGDITNQSGATRLSVQSSGMILLNGVGDYLTIRINNNTGNNGNVINEPTLSYLNLFSM